MRVGFASIGRRDALRLFLKDEIDEIVAKLRRVVWHSFQQKRNLLFHFVRSFVGISLPRIVCEYGLHGQCGVNKFMGCAQAPHHFVEGDAIREAVVFRYKKKEDGKGLVS